MDRRFALFLAFIAVSVYANTLLNDFVAGDRQFILRNPFIGDPHTVLKSFTSDYWGTLGGQSFVYYRPLIVLTHFIDFSLYGLYPLGHHFSNLIFHTVVTLLVYKLFLCLIPANPWAAFAGAALFALHPVHTHSVAYVIGRTDILAAVFYVSGLILLIGGQQKKQRIAAACLCYFLALLCKEIAVTLPLVFLLYRFCWLSQHKQEGKSDLLVPFASLCATFMLYLPLRSFAVGLSAAQGVLPEWYTVWQRLSLIFIICGFYLWKLLLPLHLCFYSNLVVPGTWTEVVTSPFFLLGSLFFISCCVAVKMVPRLGFALTWIGCSLIPVLNIIRLPVLAKENYLYIPSVGFCLLFAMLVAGREGKKKIVVASLLFFVGLMYGVGTCRRNSDYRDPILFLKRTLNAMPPIPTRPMEDVRFFEGAKNFYTTHRNLGRLYRERGQWEKAIASFEEALSYVPSYFDRQYAADIKVSLGSAYEKTGRLEEAFRVLSDVLPIADRPYYVNNLLGVISTRMNDMEKAERYFKQAVKIKENYAPAHYNLGMLYMKLNKPQKGENEFRKAAQLNPKYKKFLTHNAFPPSDVQNIDE